MFTRMLIFTLALITILAGLIAVDGLANQPIAPSVVPSPTATLQPLVFPTAVSTATPAVEVEPTLVPTTVVIVEPTLVPTVVVTEETIVEPEVQPTTEPTAEPTIEPLTPRNLGSAVLPMDEDYHSQLTETGLPNACGPASLLMVLDYYGIEQSLDVVIAYHQAIPAAEGGYDPSCTENAVCTSPGALAQVAQTVYGLSVDARQGWTFADVQAALLAGHPVIADINWRLVPGNFGHFVVIYGVDAASETIFYHDPYDGSHRSASWAQFYAAWNGPIDVGDPLQPEGHRLWGMAIALR